MNRSKDLKELFRKSLIKKNTSSDTRIYFYEWSDVNRIPRVFYDWDFFERFLKTSGIKYENTDLAIMKGLNSRYIYASCYCGNNRLNISTTFYALKSTMNIFK